MTMKNKILVKLVGKRAIKVKSVITGKAMVITVN